jgi:hypothetical protein
MMTVTVERAERPADVRACRRLISALYGERYGVSFTRGRPDPLRRLEPWPDRFVLGRVGSTPVAAAGVYERATYVERFGGVSRDDIKRVAAAAGAMPTRQVVEYTKLVVAPEWSGVGLGAMFLAVTHSRGFLAPEGGPTPLVLACGKLSVFESLYARARIQTRTIAEFPVYPSHERYRSASDPMESRLVVPDLDLDPIFLSLQLPLTLDLAIDGDRRVA